LSISALRANAPDSSGLNLLPIMSGAISAVDAHAPRAFAWAATARARHADGIENLPNVGCVTALSCRDKDR
jgi:hypothetical protein